MAHCIEFNAQRGTHSFFSHKEVAWHRLGQVVQEAPNAADAIRLANLDYNVVKHPNFIGVPSTFEDKTNYYKTPNSFSTVRDDTLEILGDKLTSGYEVVQNTEAFDFFDQVIGEGKARFETAGALFNGSVIFITAKLPKVIDLGFDDTVEQYLLFTNSHDGSEALTVAFTPIRVVCNNTLQWALNNRRTEKMRFKHTRSVKQRLDAAAKSLNFAIKAGELAEETYKFLAKTKIKDYDQTVTKYIAGLFLTEDEYVIENNKVLLDDTLSTRKMNVIKGAVNYIMSGVGQNLPTTAGTAFGLYNGITGYFTHKDYNVNGQHNEQRRFTNLFNGKPHDVMSQALEDAISLANVQ